ncbi:hypothetical protein HYS97_01370 [Candidatus Daviesbacteria bacterium]|nr:hypothetical protein [Candidatus Daviesbacteria bacterium]
MSEEHQRYLNRANTTRGFPAQERINALHRLGSLTKYRGKLYFASDAEFFLPALDVIHETDKRGMLRPGGGDPFKFVEALDDVKEERDGGIYKPGRRRGPRL